ncbi:MAG: TRAP transporter small permease [Hyphomicrobiales bacterium]|nr:TRAP transporter small permease [Hyphomicrobiales bacterium]
MKIVDTITDLLAKCAAVLLGLIVVFSWIEVVSRYFFHAPTNLASSLARHIVMAAVMAMLPYLSREGYHVAMSFIYEKAPKSLSKPIGIVITGLCSVICLFSGWIAWGEFYRLFQSNETSDGMIEFPLWYVSIFMVYGFIFAAIHFARQALSGNIVQRAEV